MKLQDFDSTLGYPGDGPRERRDPPPHNLCADRALTSATRQRMLEMRGALRVWMATLIPALSLARLLTMPPHQIA